MVTVSRAIARSLLLTADMLTTSARDRKGVSAGGGGQGVGSVGSNGSARTLVVACLAFFAPVIRSTPVYVLRPPEDSSMRQGR
ncbi:hypothetical protein GCM10010492_60440 [Saccharothrix mutabilis subsp. mutabilis]|uniref:Secreted protein n=1 Tax=Saccharothrix mutabilis subsp. mutabilis TaxID=66855 RepID=A0ABN0UIN1_9PSEU